MISFIIYLEKYDNGRWTGIELCDLNEEIEDNFIGCNSIYPFFGYNKYRSSFKYLEFKVDPLPFIQLIPQDISPEFDEYYFAGCEQSPGMFLISDALAFDYDQIAYDDITYRDALHDNYFALLELAKSNNMSRIIFYFS